MVYDEINIALQHAQCELGPAELHGCLTGLMCTTGGPVGEQWLAKVTGSTVDQLDPAFSELESEALRQLLAGQFEFQLLLPDDDENLDWRSAELVRWCVGFLSGLALGGFSANDNLSEDVQEALVDLAELAQAEIEESEGADADEADLMEIAEYTRMSAMLVFESLNAPEQSTEDEQRVLH